MQEVTSILSALRESGVKLWVVDGKLHCRATRGAVTSSQIETLRDLKQELITALTRQQSLLETEVPVPSVSSNLVLPAPISLQQELYWSAYWNCKQSGTQYHGMDTFALRLLGTLNVHHLRRSVMAVVERHAVLRTRIVLVHGAPMQVVDDSIQNCFKTVSVKGDTIGEVHDAAVQFIEKLSDRSPDWSVGPLFEANLLKLAPCDHVLAVAIDHVITDGLSMVLFFRELWSAYDDLLLGGNVSLGSAPMQYHEYATWQQSAACGEQHRKEDYWKSKLAGASQMRFPTDCDIEDTPSFLTKTRVFPFGETLSIALHDLAAEERTTPCMVVLALYAAALSRWCNKKDLVIITTVDGRSQVAHLHVMGCFVDHMPLRVCLHGNETFIDLLALVSQQFYAGREYMDFKFSGLITQELWSGAFFNWLGEELCTAYEPLSCDGVQLAAPAAMPMPSQLDGSVLSIEPFPKEGRPPKKNTSSLPMRVTFTYLAQGLCGIVWYRTDLFRVSTIERFEKILVSLAQFVVRNPAYYSMKIRGTG